LYLTTSAAEAMPIAKTINMVKKNLNMLVITDPPMLLLCIYYNKTGFNSQPRSKCSNLLGIFVHFSCSGSGALRLVIGDHFFANSAFISINAR